MSRRPRRLSEHHQRVRARRESPPVRPSEAAESISPNDASTDSTSSPSRAAALWSEASTIRRIRRSIGPSGAAAREGKPAARARSSSPSAARRWPAQPRDIRHSTTCSPCGITAAACARLRSVPSSSRSVRHDGSAHSRCAKRRLRVEHGSIARPGSRREIGRCARLDHPTAARRRGPDRSLRFTDVVGDADERGARHCSRARRSSVARLLALEPAERLVENDQARAGPAEPPPEAHALPLSARHQRPSFAERRLQAIGKLLDEPRRSARAMRDGEAAGARCSPNSRFSMSDRFQSWTAGSTHAVCSTQRVETRAVEGAPSTSTSPEAGRCHPSSRPTSVDLPAPDDPTIAT